MVEAPGPHFSSGMHGRKPESVRNGSDRDAGTDVKAGLKSRLAVWTALAALTVGGSACFAAVQLFNAESAAVNRRIEDTQGRLARLLEDGFSRTENVMRETAYFISATPSATADDLQGVFRYLTGRAAPGSFLPRSPLLGGHLFPWEYIAWYDYRSGSITATPGTDLALVSPDSLGDLVMSDSGGSGSAGLRIGKALYGATGNRWTLPAALTVYGPKGEKLGALVVGLALDGIAGAMENALSGGDVDFFLADDDLFFIAQSPERSPERLSHELVRFLNDSIYVKGKQEGYAPTKLTEPSRPPYAFKRLHSLPLYIGAGYNPEALDLTLWQKLRTLAVCASVALAALWALSALLRRAVLRPVERLASLYQRARRGEDLPSVNTSGAKEVQALAEMASALAAKKRETEALRTELIRSRELTLSALRRVTHDLKTPLTQILGFSEIALREYAGPEAEKQKEYIRLIREAALCQHLLINSFTEQIKTPEECADQPVRKERADPERAASDVIKALRSRAIDKGVEISVESEPDLPALSVDKREFNCALLCLLSNAVKYNRSGGSAKIVLRASHDRRFIRVSCEDTGLGIPEEGMRQLFTPFLRPPSAQPNGGGAPRPDGAGLGLAYVKRTVYRHDGYIMADSEPGKGTSIACYFPASEDPADRARDSMECSSSEKAPLLDGPKAAHAVGCDEDPLYDEGFAAALSASGSAVEVITGVKEAADSEIVAPESGAEAA